jgi:hypothetical protein
VLEPLESGGLVLSPAFEPLGVLASALKRPRRDIVLATVVEGSRAVEVEYFGPLQDAGCRTQEYETMKAHNNSMQRTALRAAADAER